MLNEHAREQLEKQQYRIVGHHSGVKVCGWTKNMLKGQGGCYKLKFYGINSLQCLQMTSSFSCANRCIFCWRDYKAPVSTQWKWAVDEPQTILEGTLHAQKKLLEGFGGNKAVNKEAFQRSKTVKHVALSLNGESLTYPRVNELIDLYHKKGMSTFVVTNGQYPQAIKDLRPVTQLYLSMDAPHEALSKEVGRPLFPHAWQRFLDSCDALAQKKERTAVRITMIKGLNDIDPEKYAALITRADADIIEVKGYMHVGASQERLARDNMPLHVDVLSFAQEILAYLPDYELVSEHIPSRVVELVKKSFKKNGRWQTWIDFESWTKQITGGASCIDVHSYCVPTPSQFIGIRSTSSTSPQKNKQQHLEDIKVLIDEEKPAYLSVCEIGEESELE